MLVLTTAICGLAAGARPVVQRLPTSMRAFRAARPSMAITTEESGEFGTTDFVMTFKEDGKVISPWHDAPLELEGGMYNMLTEIPKMTFKKPLTARRR